MSELGYHPVKSDRNHSGLLDALCEVGALARTDAPDAAKLARTRQIAIEDVLIHGFQVSPLTIAMTQSTRLGVQFINPVQLPPDGAAIDTFGAHDALQLGLMPWRRIGGVMVILAVSPEQFIKQSNRLNAAFGPTRMALSTADLIGSAIEASACIHLAHNAETTVDASLSSRQWNARRMMCAWLLVVASLIAATVAFGGTVLTVLSSVTVVLLLINSLLKAAAAVACFTKPADPALMQLPRDNLPTITILVPLFKETAIAQHLLKRLQHLDYPRAQLDVCLVTESDDTTTRAALGQTTLPLWMRPVIVPQGTLRTKPRALNYAMNFAKGTIVGVYDAEDAPAPDQLLQVAALFANRPPQVVCLQGVLDYYNASTNWLTRCFTIEYAAWFRVILPGLQRLGLVVPLGGTTLFFRREALDELGGWDAHNVTEDADLGVRLARFGYRTELISSVTQEEANGRFWPWIKQRSRWLKGYAITYAVHMKNPARLWADLGPIRFLGVQLLFAGTLAQFLLAPVLWTFWVVPFGIAHPFVEMMNPTQFWVLVCMFFTAELVSIIVSAIALHKAKKTWLLKWVLTLQLYFPLASFGAYKGLLELAWKPFYWDKTTHGVLLPKDDHP